MTKNEMILKHQIEILEYEKLLKKKELENLVLIANINNDYEVLEMRDYYERYALRIPKEDNQYINSQIELLLKELNDITIQLSILRGEDNE